MNDQVFRRIAELIESHPSVVDFADFGNGVSSGWIEKAEEALGISLPETYKWWLKNYGGGEVGGEEIFSVYGLEFDDAVGGDIVYLYRLAQKNNRDPELIPLCQSDLDGLFWFKVEDGLQGNEYRVFSEATGEQYADNFLDFLEMRIKAFI